MNYNLATPTDLAIEKQRIVDAYSKLGEKFVELQKKKANEWMSLRNLYKSDAQAERAWDRMEPGIEMIEVKQKMKNYLMRISAINTSIRIKEGEAKNQW